MARSKGEKYRIHVRTVPNPDFGDIVSPAPPTTLTASTIGELRRILHRHIRDYDIGGGNFVSPPVYYDGKRIGYMSYNGSVWKTRGWPAEEVTTFPEQKARTNQRKHGAGKTRKNQSLPRWLTEIEMEEYRFPTKAAAQEFKKGLASYRTEGRVNLRKSIPLYRHGVAKGYSVFVRPMGLGDAHEIARFAVSLGGGLREKGSMFEPWEAGNQGPQGTKKRKSARNNSSRKATDKEAFLLGFAWGQQKGSRELPPQEILRRHKHFTPRQAEIFHNGYVDGKEGDTWRLERLLSGKGNVGRNKEKQRRNSVKKNAKKNPLYADDKAAIRKVVQELPKSATPGRVRQKVASVLRRGAKNVGTKVGKNALDAAREYASEYQGKRKARKKTKKKIASKKSGTKKNAQKKTRKNAKKTTRKKAGKAKSRKAGRNAGPARLYLLKNRSPLGSVPMTAANKKYLRDRFHMSREFRDGAGNEYWQVTGEKKRKAGSVASNGSVKNLAKKAQRSLKRRKR